MRPAIEYCVQCGHPMFSWTHTWEEGMLPFRVCMRFIIDADGYVRDRCGCILDSLD